MGEYLNSVLDMATTIANLVESSYQTTDMEVYENILGNIISANDIVLGSGLWFEPYAFDSNEKYMGPYVYKDGGSMVTTYDYSNEDYDYFSQEYYTMCIGETEALFTDPYYDPTSDTIMSSCSCPLIVNGAFIGCVTVDIELGTITDLIDNIVVGKTGSAILTTGDGTYLAGVAADKVQNAENISADSNASLAKAGSSIIANESGESTYSEKGKINLYYSTLESTGWKLILQMPQAELNAPLNKLMVTLFAVSAVALVLAVFVVLIQVRSIAKSIGMVQIFAGSLAGKFAEIKEYMQDVNSAMLSTSAATEEVNASTEEVLSNVNILAEETEQSMKMAVEISGRAENVGTSSRDAYESATKLSSQFESRLQ